MAATIKDYYKEELSDWSNSINYYLKELAELSVQLEAVILRNSIVGIARKVEGHQEILNRSGEKFHGLQKEILLQLNLLNKDGEAQKEHAIQEEVERAQNELRRMMHFVSKEFMDAQFNCQNFLSETFGKRLL
ncbi:MAG: hypothetical protein KGM98_08195 [Bacteroidota bacterium]|nr:hypothetical protein [Bacteroidota bacterium]